MVTIRPATEQDVSLVAWAVLTALDLPADSLQTAESACRLPDTLYSYTNALIAWSDGEPAGCLISYPGANYLAQRERTWQMIWGDSFESEVVDYSTVAIETEPGEYYLDTMAVLPPFRGKGIGHRLMQEAMTLSGHQGRFALIVSVDKPRLETYYAELGFRSVGELEFFGHRYHKMTM